MNSSDEMIHYDFIEVRQHETFADREYKKWLAERRKERQQSPVNVRAQLNGEDPS